MLFLFPFYLLWLSCVPTSTFSPYFYHSALFRIHPLITPTQKQQRSSIPSAGPFSPPLPLPWFPGVWLVQQCLIFSPLDLHIYFYVTVSIFLSELYILRHSPKRKLHVEIKSQLVRALNNNLCGEKASHYSVLCLGLNNLYTSEQHITAFPCSKS